jgi:hypothetical protein
VFVKVKLLKNDFAGTNVGNKSLLGCVGLKMEIAEL